MARPGCDTLIVSGLAILLVIAMPCAAQQGSLDAARKAFARGDTRAALEALRTVRSSAPDRPVLVESLALGVHYSLAAGDVYKASYFLQLLQEADPGSAAAFEAGLSVAGWYYDRRSWRTALEYFGRAIDGAGAMDRGKGLDLALLRRAELCLYFAEDAGTARLSFRRIDPDNLPASETALYKALSVRLFWSVLTSSGLGLADANVSSLMVDGDDLWVGTWNGGVSRYSVSSSRADPFPLPSFSRSIETAGQRVWIGTAEGLAWYCKSSGRWGAESDFRSPTPRKVQVVREAAGSLYVGTLGDGLFRRGAGGWEKLSSGDLPGKLITCIAADPGDRRLLIGTMNRGLVLYDLRTGKMSTLAKEVPAFTSANIGTILPDSQGRVWVGTYGEGLFAWQTDSGTIRHYTKATGEISDDWVLAGCETDRALYFGSFGGGSDVYLKAPGSWRHMGIRDGLASLDVTAIAWHRPFVFFGTLGAGVSVYDEEADAENP